MIAHFADRRETIRTQLNEHANGDTVVMPESLLDEVTSLVEWPVVYPCRFEDEFLQVPQECLILTMQTNQKYFALTDVAGKAALALPDRVEHRDEDAGRDHRRQRARRAPAPRRCEVLLRAGQKKPLAERVPQLANVVYHNKLGSALARVERLEALAGEIAPRSVPTPRTRSAPRVSRRPTC